MSPLHLNNKLMYNFEICLYSVNAHFHSEHPSSASVWNRLAPNVRYVGLLPDLESHNKSMLPQRLLEHTPVVKAPEEIVLIFFYHFNLTHTSVILLNLCKLNP